VSSLQPLLENYFHNEILSNEIKSVSVHEEAAFRFNGLLVPLSDATSNLIGCIGIQTADLSLTSSDTRNNLLTISEQVMDIFRAVLIKEELFAVKKQKSISEKKINEIENILNYTNENSPLGN
jgi:cob(I)alamin adenosyltransferase